MILCVCPNPSVDTSWELEGDRVRPGSTTRISGERRYPGGKATHVALALREIGADVLLMGIWAGDNGRFIQAACHQYGLATTGIDLNRGDSNNKDHDNIYNDRATSNGPVAIRNVARQTAENRSCYTIRSLDPQWNNTELLGQGPVLGSKDYIRFLDVYKGFIAKGKIDLIVLAGSWPWLWPNLEDSSDQINDNKMTSGNNAEASRIGQHQSVDPLLDEPIQHLYHKDPYGPFIDAANDLGIPVWLDCAGKHLAAAIGLLDTTTGRPQGAASDSHLSRRFYGIHINEAELVGMADILMSDRHSNRGPSSASLAEQALAVLRRKTELLAITKGSKGLYLSQSDVCVHAVVDLAVVPHTIKTKEAPFTYSTVGCGDCLMAGLVFASQPESIFPPVGLKLRSDSDDQKKSAIAEPSLKGADTHRSWSLTHKTVFSLIEVAKYGAAAGAANILRQEIGMLYGADMRNLLEWVSTKQLL